MTTTRTSITGAYTALRKDVATAATGAIALSATAVKATELKSVSLNLNTAPTTSENFTITLNANAGAAYDILLYSVDLSSGSTTTMVWYPDEPLFLETGDSIDVAYTNTDTRTYGVQITMLELV